MFTLSCCLTMRNTDTRYELVNRELGLGSRFISANQTPNLFSLSTGGESMKSAPLHWRSRCISQFSMLGFIGVRYVCNLESENNSLYSASPIKVNAAQLSGSGYFCLVVSIACLSA